MCHRRPGLGVSEDAARDRERRGRKRERDDRISTFTELRSLIQELEGPIGGH